MKYLNAKYWSWSFPGTAGRGLLRPGKAGADKMARSYKKPPAVISQLLPLYYPFIYYNMKLHTLIRKCLEEEDSYTRQIGRYCKT